MSNCSLDERIMTSGRFVKGAWIEESIEEKQKRETIEFFEKLLAGCKNNSNPTIDPIIGDDYSFPQRTELSEKIDKAIKAVDWSNLSKPKIEPTKFNKFIYFIKRNSHMIIGFIVGILIGQVIVYFILK